MNKKYQIAIIIPSLNEAATIESVAKKIDLGLTRFFPDKTALILNIDNGSQDKTREVFLAAETKNDKLTIVAEGPVAGKGNNVLAGLKLAKKFKASYLATIDADLLSLRPEWIKHLLLPLINKEVDLTTPLYQRNRYEGNTTNHFCVPILKNYFQANIRQPIAGDFGFNSDLAEYLLKNRAPKSAHRYGIDIFLTTHAIAGGFKFKEVFLGEKIHRPSFEAMVPMFNQVAQTLMFLINYYPSPKKQDSIKTDLASRRSGIAPWAKKPSEESTRERFLLATKLFNQTTRKRACPLGKDFLKELEAENFQLDGKKWSLVLSQFVAYLKSCRKIDDKEIERLTNLLTPLYLFRVLTYFEEIEKLSPEEVEKIFDYQVGKDLQ